MQMNDLYSHSLGTYQAHPHYYGQGQGHQSLAMHYGHADPSLLLTVRMPRMNTLIYYIAIILFGAQAFATPIGLLCSSRLFQFTYLVALFVKVTIHSLIMSRSGM